MRAFEVVAVIALSASAYDLREQAHSLKDKVLHGDDTPSGFTQGNCKLDDEFYVSELPDF